MRIPIESTLVNIRNNIPRRTISSIRAQIHWCLVEPTQKYVPDFGIQVEFQSYQDAMKSSGRFDDWGSQFASTAYEHKPREMLFSNERVRGRFWDSKNCCFGKFEPRFGDEPLKGKRFQDREDVKRSRCQLFKKVTLEVLRKVVGSLE